MLEARTDALGWARILWPISEPQIYVIIPGVGYGATGEFAVQVKQPLRPALPPLAPLGTIEGTVPEQLRIPNVKVVLNGMEWMVTAANCDAKGHFTLKDVPYGGYYVQAARKNERNDKLFAKAPVFVGPGQHVKNLDLVMSERKYLPWIPPAGPRGKGSETIVWAEGTVRDEAGRPIEGAEVSISASYFGGLRFYYVSYQTLTNAEGHYQITGKAQLSMVGGTVLAFKVGHPYSVVPLRDPSSEEAVEPIANQAADKSAANPRYDFVLSDQSCRLDVLVTRDGKPETDAAVTVAQDLGPDLYPSGRVLCPEAFTDEAGIAHFADLPSGVYTISATGHAAEGRRSTPSGWRRDDPEQASKYRGIALRPGPPCKFHVDRGQVDNSVRMQLRQPDGKPTAGTRADLQWSGIGEDGYRQEIEFDAQGLYELKVDRAGLWRIKLHYPNPRTKASAAFDPYNEAEAIVAASPLLKDDPPVVLAATHRTPTPPSLHVQLKDASGKPAKGYVFFGRGALNPSRAATTDDQGNATFDGIVEWPAIAESYLPGLVNPRFGTESKTWPDDKELVGRVSLFPEEIDPKVKSVTQLVLQPKPVGYVRGLIRPAKGKSLDDYAINLKRGSMAQIAVSGRDRTTGQFLIGPIAEGKTELTLSCRVTKNHWPHVLTREIEVKADRVLNVELDAPEIPAAPKSPFREPAFITIGAEGASVIGELAGRTEGVVLLPDRKSPAAGAQVVLFVPGESQQVAHATVNSAGRFSLVGSRVSRNNTVAKLPAIDGPTLVAWRLGSHGAVIMPYAKDKPNAEVQLVLPKSLSQRGKVTIAGKPVSSAHSQLSVFAAYQGNRPFDGLFHQICSADADGVFELTGLTPGKYQVQATLDDIWLSASVPVTVSADAETLAPIVLDIGEPGCATVVTLLDKQGRPLADVQATLERPAGPLTDRCWPTTFTSDHAGVLGIPPLEAGEHLITFPGSNAAQKWQVTKLSEPHRPIKLQWTVDKTAK
jgi:hypothetical protein